MMLLIFVQPKYAHIKKVLHHSFEVLNRIKIEPIYFVSYLIDLLEYLLLHIFFDHLLFNK